MNEYDHNEIEPKWQKKWEEDNLYETPENPDPENASYVLGMFPYPSGSGLHVGHVESFTGTDVYARFLRMQGKDVLFPMGWDAFGLPAENYAIKTGTHPRERTSTAIETFRSQLDSLGLSYDWKREVNTSKPEYYRWTQKLFTTLFEEGLAEKKPDTVNWCPDCQTVLANAQVIDDLCERCDTEVQEKEMDQWFFNTTAYADELVDGLDGLDWPESTKELQRNWIGRQEGARFAFDISVEESDESIEVFTTRPDTLFGVTYLALAPEHEQITNLKNQVSNWSEVREYINQAKEKSDKKRQEAEEKTGIKLEGVTATHPATGEELPVFVADYVLPDYGTGAIMAVPAHDDRDHAFAKEHDLKIKQVVAPHVVDDVNPPEDDAEDTTRDMVHAIVRKPETGEFLSLSWNDHDWQTFITGGVEEGESVKAAGRREVAEETGYTDMEFVQQVGPVIRADFHAAHKGVNREVKAHFVLFDVVSDQQNSVDQEEKEKHTPEWMEIENMSELSPVSELPYIVRWFEEGYYAYAGEGELINSEDFNGLDSDAAAEKITEKFGEKKTTYKLQDWSIGRQRYWGAPIPIVYDPDGQPHPVPDEHLPWKLPGDVPFEPTGEPPLAKSEELQERVEDIFGEGWTPETETMDTFVDSSWYFLRYPDPHNDDRFAGKEALKTWCPVDMYIGGAEHAVLHLLYARFITKALADAGKLDFREPFESLRHQGMVLAEDGTKMSKSKGNVVNPNEVVDQVGADTLRMYELFAGPFSESFDWDTDAIAGPRRFIERVWRLFAEHEPEVEPVGQPPEGDTLMHQTTRSVTEDIDDFRFNTAISSLMEAQNELAERDTVSADSLSVFVRLLAPFAPHAAEELWSQYGGVGSVHEQSWPAYTAEAAEELTVDIAIQINGTVRGEMTVDKTADEDTIVAQAKEVTNVKKRLEDTTITRHIYVPDKLVNFVTEE